MSQAMKDDPEFVVRANILKPGEIAVDFNFTLTTGVQLKLSELCKKGPVLVNFIKGTWCPFCTTHLSNLRKWQNNLDGKNITLLALSNEELESLRSWSKQNSIDYLFGQVTENSTFEKYGINIDNESFPYPTTFLIEKDLVIRFSHTGKRDEKLDIKIGNLS